ncbi:MAG: glucosamine-6-phosphate deaminase [Candidatus Aminicenantes bacterium]|nr:glucosamine-6-phosphate deaminase [Candidatus Aminicenantes bacterium]NIM78098.1 glucosamine-6-phosphate deaminase [Candidatus Aminicenantes bacterium]NIN17416.1 glucosamine-6-phosphate deaminase [Candidatus Aminicenantes bacterium]NIN41312.1 glucosamine-6-phosphate deaminase [Candidatus Aminicenantes bacterium]NIN84082.1 glucosamine-6-phosphate deaminase [Candidatus Aminicenantes bacterium]
MEVIIQPDKKAASSLAARIVAQLIQRKGECVLGLATGNTPLMLYKELIRLHKQGELDFERVTTFNLDEYVGLSPSHPASYTSYMWENFFKHINIPAHRVHIPDGLAPDIPAFCRQYEGAIKAAGGIDIQVLGIGTDGHIGFNEPSSSLASRTRIKTLTKQTLEDNARFFNGEENVPHHVITMGVGTIMESRKCLLMAFGKKKADVVARMVEGPITAMVPASILQMHPEAVVIIDEAAASKLERSDYYRWVYDNKPDWQKY